MYSGAAVCMPKLIVQAVMLALGLPPRLVLVLQWRRGYDGGRVIVGLDCRPDPRV